MFCTIYVNWTLFCCLPFNLWFNALMSLWYMFYNRTTKFLCFESTNACIKVICYSFFFKTHANYWPKLLISKYCYFVFIKNYQLSRILYFAQNNVKIVDFSFSSIPKHSCKLRCSTFHHYTTEHNIWNILILTTHTKSYTREVSNLKVGV